MIDFFQVTVKLYDATIKTVNVWEVQSVGRVEKEDDKGGRKRKRRSEGIAKPDDTPHVQQPGPPPPAAESASLSFVFVLMLVVQ